MMSNLDGTNHGGSKVPRPSADQTEGEYLSAKKRMRPGEEYESGKKSRLTVEPLARSGNNKNSSNTVEGILRVRAVYVVVCTTQRYLES